MMDKKETNTTLRKQIGIIFLAIIGFLITIKLAMIYYDSNFK
jgi:preprotein translocase subunit Sss1